jgi:hypothetical protein
VEQAQWWRAWLSIHHASSSRLADIMPGGSRDYASEERPAAMLIEWRNLSKRALWPAIWLAGLALIIYYAPFIYRPLKLPDGEQIAGFRGQSHDLIVVAGGPKVAERKQWRPLPPPAAASNPPHSGVEKRDGIHSELVQTDATLKAVPLGSSLYLWNIDQDLKRSLSLDGSPEIYDLISCADGSRVFVDHVIKIDCQHSEPTSPLDSGCRIAVFDGATGKRLKTIKSSCPGGLQSVRNDGKMLAYSPVLGLELGMACLEVDSGKEVYSGRGIDAVISPNGEYVAITEEVDFNKRLAKSPHGIMMNLTQGRRIDFADTAYGSFSPSGDRFVDRSGGVWKIASNKRIYKAPSPGVFIDNGKKIAWAENKSDGLLLKFRDIETDKDLDTWSFSIFEHPGSIEAIGPAGNLIRIDATEWPPALTWFQKVLDRVGVKQTPAERHQWLIIDAGSGHLLHHGRDQLIAVSTDGRYVISGECYQTDMRLYELPLRKSIPFIIIGCVVWTPLLLIGRRLLRRRLKPLFADVSEPLQKRAAAYALP